MSGLALEDWVTTILPKIRDLSAGHVARKGDRRGILVGNPEGRDHFEDPTADGRIILRWILRKWDVGVWTGSSWLRKGTGGGHL